MPRKITEMGEVSRRAPVSLTKKETNMEPNQGKQPLDEALQKELGAAHDVVSEHFFRVKRALESLQQLVRGDVSITQFRDLRDAIEGFTPARAAVEKGRKIVKARLEAELKGEFKKPTKSSETE